MADAQTQPQPAGLTRLMTSGPEAGDAPVVLLVAVLVLLASALAVALNVRHAAKAQAQADAVSPRKRLTRKMSSIGRTTLVTEVETNLSIPVSVLTLRGALGRDEYVERLRERMGKDAFFSRFRSLVTSVDGAMVFTELPDFDAADNVKQHTLRAGETTISYVESLVNTPLDFAKPLWEMHVISPDPSGADRDASVAWKVHHCLGDGASLATAMVKLSDQSDQFDAMLAKMQQSHKSKPAKPRKAPAQIARDLAGLAALLGWSLLVITRKLLALAFRREPATMFKRPGRTTKRLSYNVMYSVAVTKAIGKQYGATVNDVMLSVVAGAMRQTMLHAAEHDQQDSAQVVPPGLVVRAAIPVDMRASSEVIRASRNKFSSLVIDFPVGEADPLKRLRKVRAAMGEAKNSLEKVFTYWSSHLVSSLPAALTKRIVHFTTSRISVAISNVRGSAFDISVCDKPLLGFFGFVPPPPTVNLGIAILSVGDSLGLNVLVDPSVGIDAQQFLVFAKREFDVLEQAAITAKAAESATPADKKHN
jgi:diacylglycerol O-acyltransferase